MKKKSVLQSPLRYPGSKRCLVHYMDEVISLNTSAPALFVEPFAGGSSVALQLLEWQVVERIGLIDSDPLITDFWNAVFFDTDWLIKEIYSIPVTLEKWYWFKSLKPANTRESAMKCLFLNRTSFSGIIAPKVGPIGGKNQISPHRIDCRFTRETLVRRIKKAARLKHRVEFIWNTDWHNGLFCLRERQRRMPYLKDCFLYFDPPFFEKAERLYNHYFNEKDHVDLRNFLRELCLPWVLSYDSVRKVTELYEDPEVPMEAQRIHIDLIYTTSGSSKRRTAREVIISNLELPAPPKTDKEPKQETSVKDCPCDNAVYMESDCVLSGSME
jgi:DNA adenine methylase